MKLLLDPHGDDGVLFAAFSIQRACKNNDLVVMVVFDSFVQVRRGFPACDMVTRRTEAVRGLHELGVIASKVLFLGFSDDFKQDGPVSVEEIADKIRDTVDVNAVSDVWMPEYETLAHKQHNLVSMAGMDVFKNAANVSCYSTYTSEGKSTKGGLLIPTGKEVYKKLKAMTQFQTQIEIQGLGCWPHFIRDQNEYLSELVKVDEKTRGSN